MIRIDRISDMLYTFAKSDKDGKRHIATALTFIDPDPEKLRRKWELFNKRDFTFQRGMIWEVIAYLNKKNLHHVLFDYEYDGLPTEIDPRLTGKYDHQRQAVEAFFQRRFGIIKVPTRGGKTFIASELLRQFQVADPEGGFLFVVDTEDLFNQAVRDIQSFFEPYGGIEIGEIKAGKIAPKRVTVAMIQTLQSRLSKRATTRDRMGVEKYLRTVKFLIIDEIHENFSTERKKVYDKCRRLDYLLCLSATPFRSGTWATNLKLRAWSGDVIYTVPEATLIEKEVLTEYQVYLLAIDHNDKSYTEIIGGDWIEFRDAVIWKNEYRDRMLIRVMEICERLGLKTLLIFQSVAHGERIAERTGVTFINGKHKTSEREKQMNIFLEGDSGMLAASGIFKKGITLPEAAVMINVDGGLEEANTIQKKGRVLGRTDQKVRSAVIDFMDIFDMYFGEHSAARLNTYVQQIGEENVHAIDTDENTDWDKTLEIWLKEWFG